MGQEYNNTNKGKFKHITYSERTQIERWFNIDKLTKTKIAELLSKSVKTIRREINKNMVENLNSDLTKKLVYSAEIAQNKYDYNMTSKGPNMILDQSMDLCKYIEKEIIEEKKSPEALSHIIKGKSEFPNISARAIRYAIEGGEIFDKLKPGKIIYKKKYKAKNPSKRVCDKVPAEKSIEYRPEKANNRSEYGHWEGDLVIGTRKKGKVLLTFTERVTREEIIVLINSKSALSVAEGIDSIERKYKGKFKDKFKTITFDNGAEFRNYKLLEKSVFNNSETRTNIYYAHPYSSGERGSNENANRLIRRFIPKGKSMNDLTNKIVRRIEKWINEYPRSIFGYKSSNEYRKELGFM